MTHLDGAGRARMVDVSGKPTTLREAVAAGSITMSAVAYRTLRTGRIAKGDAPALARVAGIAAAKRTAELIPLCHAVPLDHVAVDLRFDDAARAVKVEATARTRWSTGVEMEALVAVTAALLTLYDMAKAVDRGMTLGPIGLLRKSGGRSGAFVRGVAPVRGAPLHSPGRRNRRRERGR
ncbi:MAG TPA: cyclic pyranopterin monophosphate synthase MoaC [Candidatus Polarisedimenticolia bacterium]|nr:cyclic pyranopterin monophosphate synthase MoaC [Candidatus Polarisedimenticolia bacterium]